MLIKQGQKFIKLHPGLVITGLVTLILAGLYLSIAPGRLTNANFGGDGGDFLTAILTGGIPHPTGYPSYILLGFLFQSLPFNTPVFRAVLESLFPAALAGGLLSAWVLFIQSRNSLPHLVAALIAGIAWGSAPLLFSQAVIIEVHGLQSLVSILILWWVTLNLWGIPSHNKWLLCLSFLIGLGFGNHVMGLLFVPVILAILVYSRRSTGTWIQPLLQLSLILIGLFVYAYLPLRARLFPPINWGNPQTWSGFIWEITANPYQGLLFSTDNSFLWDRIRSIFSLLLDQFGPLGLVAGVIGAIQYPFTHKWLRWVLVWTFLVYFAFSIGYNTQDSVGYLLPAIMVFAIWVGLAVPALTQISWKKIPLGLVLASILAISISLRLPATRARLDPRVQDQPARYAEGFIKAAPQNSIVFTTTDGDTFPLWYYHFGLHQRQDLRLIVLPLTQFVWYQETLMHNYHDLQFPALYTKDTPNADWGRQIASLNPERPVCNTQVTADSDTGVAYQCISP